MRNKLFSAHHTERNDHSGLVLASRVSGFLMLPILTLSVLQPVQQIHAQEDVSLIQQEIDRRSGDVEQAQVLLKAGDEAYKSEDFKKAVESYKEAFELIPEAGLTHELRFAAGDRYAQAAVEYGKILARTGQYDEAKKHLNDVLSEDVAPGNAGAMKMLAKLDDPIRFSPTLTPDHVRNIEQVAHWLRKGESLFLQAQYYEALVAYEEVIKIDPTNIAARRGMERVVSNIASSANAARDQTRSDFLTEVDSLWEKKVNPSDHFSVISDKEAADLDVRIQEVRGSKLEQIIIPTVEFDDVSLTEAINSVRVWARELDTTELDPEKKGMNFVMRLGDNESGFKKKIENAKINLTLRNVPLSVVLDDITQQTGTYWKQEQFSVVIRPLGSYTAELETRTFRVPIGFMDDEDTEKPDDVFGDAAALQAKSGIVDALKKLGISFPDGATAFHNRANNTLRVTNAPQELDSIEAFIRAQSMKESVMVVIKTTIVEMSETTLNELGFDHLVDPTHVKNNVFATGGTPGNGNVIEAVPGVVGGNAILGNGVTSGNRSGDTMFAIDSIDAKIAGFETPSVARASSPLSFTSEINDATFQTIMRALSQKKGEARLNQSTTVSLAGQRVEISAVNEITYPSEYEPAEIPQAAVGAGPGEPVVVTPSAPTAFENRALGYQILVEPTVSDDKNYIDLQLNPSIVTFDGFVNYGSPLFNVVVDPITGIPFEQLAQVNPILMPIFSTVRLNTGVTVQDGATVVVGGLLQQKIETIDDKVPMLGDLPMVGRLFKSQGLKNTRTAIIMFVNVELVDPTGHPWRDR